MHNSLAIVLVMFIPCVMNQGTCPAPPTANVFLSSSFEEDGRRFACPEERVVFTCHVYQSVVIRLAAEYFICRIDPVLYTAFDNIGRLGPPNPFQANLTNVQRESNQSLIANFTVTLTVNTTDETTNTVVECADILTSSNVQRKNLTQSLTPSRPTGVYHRFVCILYDENCTIQELDRISSNRTCRCQSFELVLFWEEANGDFDFLHYLVNVSSVEGTVMGNVTGTSFTVRAASGIDYLVLLHTVSKCQQISSAAVIENSVNGTVSAASSFDFQPPSIDGGIDNGAIVGGLVGGIGDALLLILLITIMIVVIVKLLRCQNKTTVQVVPEEKRQGPDFSTPGEEESQLECKVTLSKKKRSHTVKFAAAKCNQALKRQLENSQKPITLTLKKHNVTSLIH